MTGTVKSWIEERRRIRDCEPTLLERADTEVAFPRALDAIEAVLKVHTPIEVNHAFKGRTNVCEQCSEDRLYALWPCETVQAIEGAINGERG